MGRLSECDVEIWATMLTQSSKLAASIPEVEALRKKMKQWPPVNSGVEKYPRGLAGVMAEEMGWVD